MSDVAARHVVVVGGGIAGLAAAHRLLSSPGAPRVTVVEAADELGGKIRTTPFAGRPAVDEGADAFLARVPWAVDLARDLRLTDQLASPTASGAFVWFDGLHPIPDGLLLGLPTGIRALAGSHLLSWRGKARAALEPFLPRTDLAADSVGAFVRTRFGDQVHERLVDPLIGSIYATDTNRFSLAAVPQLAAVAARDRSVLLGARRSRRTAAAAASGPIFLTPTDGVAALVRAAAEAIVELGGEIVTGERIDSLERTGDGWLVGGRAADGVVLACPAFAAAPLLSATSPDAARGLASIEYADVALITIALAPHTLPRGVSGRSGYLVPKPVQRLVTAVSFGSQKWDHWAAGDGSALLRISLGRDGLPVLHLTDEQLVAAALDEVGAHLGITLEPTDIRISRWHRAFPQYRPHHGVRTAELEATLRSDAPGVLVAGASYHGIGIPACIRSGQQAADVLMPGDHHVRH